MDLFAILSLTNPKVRRATSLLAQDDTLKGLLRELRTNGRTQFAPTDEIKIFCFIAYGSLFLTVTILDRRQLVAGTHGPYRIDIDLLFR